MSNSEKHQDSKHKKTYSIIVNGRPREICDRKLSYLEVIELAYPGEQPTDTIVFTVTYSKPHGKDGTLVEGGKEVRTKDGMIFNVRRTDQS